MIVAIEKRPRITILNRIASAVNGGNFQVVRFNSPMRVSGEVLPKCDAVVLFNGAHPKYRSIVDTARRRGVYTIFIELGWLPQRPYNQVDFNGINADVSWANDSLGNVSDSPIKLKPGKLLVPLQNDEDVSIRSQSPWFSCMFQFLKYLGEHSTMPLIIRKHPRHIAKTDRRVIRLVEGSKKMVWDQSPSLTVALGNARAVATINSTSGLEAIAAGCPVLCFGHAIYRRDDVVICLDNGAKRTRRAIEAIVKGKISLNAGNMQAFIELVKSKQIHRNDTPALVVSMLKALKDNKC